MPRNPRADHFSERKSELSKGRTGAARALTARAPELGPLNHEDIPEFVSKIASVGWIAERIALGTWRAADCDALAVRWGRTPTTVRDYATEASTAVQLHAGDIEKIRLAAVVRLQTLASDQGEKTADRLKATELQLRVTGALQGGAEEHAPSAAETRQAILESIRDPGDEMQAILRQAFSDPSDALRALLAEFAVITTEGNER